MTKIEWAEKTWNALVGCSVVSPGCTNCYAMRLARRLEGFGQQQYCGITKKVNGNTVWTGEIRRAPDHRVREPLGVKRPTVWFVNSMSDLFHEGAMPEWIREIVGIMARTPWHTYQVLTKRPEQAEKFFREHPDVVWPANAWLGVSVEDSKRVGRIDVLRRLPGRIKFISAEPLLGPLGKLDLTEIHWVIGGGESGPGARPCRIEWVRELRDECRRQGVAFFMKQWGRPGNNPLVVDRPAGISAANHIKTVDPHGKGGALVDGELWRQYPGDMTAEATQPAADPDPEPEPVRTDGDGLHRQTVQAEATSDDLQAQMDTAQAEIADLQVGMETTRTLPTIMLDATTAALLLTATQDDDLQARVVARLDGATILDLIKVGPPVGLRGTLVTAYLDCLGGGPLAEPEPSPAQDDLRAVGEAEPDPYLQPVPAPAEPEPAAPVACVEEAAPTGEVVLLPVGEVYQPVNLGPWLIGNPPELLGRIGRRDNPDGTVSLRWDYMAMFGGFDPYRAAKNAKGEWRGSERGWNLKRSSADRICRLAKENGAKIVSLDVTDWSALVVQVRPLISRTDQTAVEWTLEVDLEASRASLDGDVRPLREFVQGRWVPSRIIWAKVVRDGRACGRLVTGPLTADVIEAIRSALAERGIVVQDGLPCGVSDRSAIATRDDIGLSVTVEVDPADRRTLVFASGRDGTWTGRMQIEARSWPPLRDRLQGVGLTVEERGWTPRPLPTVDWSAVEGWDCQVNGRTLRPYQRAGVEFVLGHSLRAVIGDDMGTGKTAQAAVAVRAAGCKRVAVICPKNAVSVWRREVWAWTPGRPEIVVVEGATEIPAFPEAGWVIVTFDTLTPRVEQIQLNGGYKPDQLNEIRDAFIATGASEALRIEYGADSQVVNSIRISLNPDQEDILDAVEAAALPEFFRETQRLRDALTRARGTLRATLLDWDPEAVIVDEAHRIKNPKAARTCTVRALVADRDRGAVLLTGTPLRNRSEEALTLLEALIPVDEYRTVANRTGISKAELAAFLLDRYMIRRTKGEVLPELPPKIRQRVDIGLTDKAQEEYLGEYRNAMQAAQDRYFQALVETRSRAKAAEAALGMWSAARRLLGLAKVASGIVADLVAGIVEERGACIAFAHHRDVLDMLRRQIAAAGLRIVQVDGETPISDREAAERAFQAGELDVFLGGITAAGESITLTRSDTCVFGELDWVPANLLQAEDRGHRLGQTANGYHVLTCMADFDLDPLDDMDALMWSMLSRKLWEINKVLGESTTLEAAEPQAGESVLAILEARAWERAANRMRTEGLADLIDGIN